MQRIRLKYDSSDSEEHKTQRATDADHLNMSSPPWNPPPGQRPPPQVKLNWGLPSSANAGPRPPPQVKLNWGIPSRLTPDADDLNDVTPPAKRAKTSEISAQDFSTKPVLSSKPANRKVVVSTSSTGNDDTSSRPQATPGRKRQQRSEVVSDQDLRYRAMLSAIVDESLNLPMAEVRAHVAAYLSGSRYASPELEAFFLKHALSYQESIKNVQNMHKQYMPVSGFSKDDPGLEPIFWSSALPMLLHAAGDTAKPAIATVWRVERQLINFYKDILSRIPALDTSSHRRKPWCTLDHLAQALVPDVYAVRLCEYVVKWIKTNRKTKFSQAEGEAPSDSDDDSELMEAAEISNEEGTEFLEDDGNEAGESTGQGAIAETSWRPSPQLEEQLRALAPDISAQTVAQDRLRRRHDQALLADRFDEKDYIFFSRCVRVSFARQKGRLSQFLHDFCNAGGLPGRFSSETLECLGILGSDFIVRLIARAKAAPHTSDANSGISPFHIPRYQQGDLLTLDSSADPLST